MASPAFERFRFSFFEDADSPRNGLDTAALAQLEGDERTRAEEMLIQYLPDTRGVMSDDPARREGGKRDILAAIAGRPISTP
jgi:hypothetical protein